MNKDYRKRCADGYKSKRETPSIGKMNQEFFRMHSKPSDMRNNYPLNPLEFQNRPIAVIQMIFVGAVRAMLDS